MNIYYNMRPNPPENRQQGRVHAVTIVYVQVIPATLRGELPQVDPYVGHSRRIGVMTAVPVRMPGID